MCFLELPEPNLPLMIHIIQDLRYLLKKFNQDHLPSNIYKSATEKTPPLTGTGFTEYSLTSNDPFKTQLYPCCLPEHVTDIEVCP